jgi:sulfur-carrier protein adenylyltransferase/sulfurtransferase
MSRYFQQEIVPEIGEIGQEKLKKAKVLIVGAGGLGTPVAICLTAIGVGKIGIIDGDTIEISNLNRQFLFDENQIGLYKSDIITSKLRNQNPEIEIINFNFFVSGENIDKILSEFDIVCDCSDNLETRLLLDKSSLKFKKPLVYAAVKDWEGYITILNYKRKIQLKDIFPLEELFKNEIINCSKSGIVNTTCGIAGSIQANEVIKIILGLDNQLDGKILCFNGLNMIFKKFKLNKIIN